MTDSSPTPANPYAIPTSDLSKKAVQSNETEMASRGERLLAYVLDLTFLLIILTLAATIFLIILLRSTGNPDVIMELINQQAFQSFSLVRINLLDKWIYIQIITPILVYFLVNGYLLQARGQTIGKALMNIAIIDIKTGEVPSLSRIFLRRFVLFNIPGIINNLMSIVVYFADALSIFRDDKRMLHDLLAGTIVVRV